MNQQVKVKVQCTKCKQETAGVLHFSPRLQLIDTDGGMLFAEGWSCNACLGQPWASSDVSVTR